MKRSNLAWMAIPLIIAASARSAPGADPPRPRVPEFVEMLGAILVNGADMGPNSGWFHPSQSRYGWSWLAGRFDLNRDGTLTADELKGSAPLFRALDRDGDGAVTTEDLDWSPRSRYLQSRSQGRGRFARMDRNGNGRVTRDEWNQAFEQAARGKKFLTLDDVSDMLYPPPTPPPSRAGGGRPASSSGPSRWTLLKGLFSGEIGAFTEGPGIGQEAPEFTLDTHDKARRISIADFRWKKPVVLIFGSFT